MSELTTLESRALAEAEERIERGLATFVEVGEALLTIRDMRLYRAEYRTFEDYCRERWGFSYQRAHQMISAADVVSTIVETGLPAPSNEGQARELARVPEEQRAEVWRETIERTGGKPTAAAIREIAQAEQPATDVLPSPAPEDDPLTQLEVIPVPESPRWSDDETALRDRLESGETVVISLRANHANLAEWADRRGLLVRIDRRTEWGNPFEMPDDGDRKTVIENYETHYLPHKPSLLSRLDSLRGKALGCWCAPEPCHGDVLAAWAEGRGEQC